MIDVYLALGVRMPYSSAEVQAVMVYGSYAQRTVVHVGVGDGLLTALLLAATETFTDTPITKWPRVYGITGYTNHLEVMPRPSPEPGIIQRAVDFKLNPFALSKRFCLFHGTSQVVAQDWVRAIRRPVNLLVLGDVRANALHDWLPHLSPLGYVMTERGDQRLIKPMFQAAHLEQIEQVGKLRVWQRIP